MTLTLTRANEDEALAPGPITQLRTQLEQRADEFRMVLPSHINPERFQRTTLTAAQSNPDLLKCDRRSFITACMKAAQDGLLPDGREAAIVPFNTRTKIDGEWCWLKLAQYMPMVWGLRKKILQSGEITDIFAAVVYRQEVEDGRFHYEEGTERCLRHRPNLDANFAPSVDDICLAYSVATFANGFKSFEVMRRWEINEVREASQTGAEFDAKGEPRDAKGPWVDWFGEMAKKTVIRRHSKSLPQSSDIMADVEAEDMAFASRSALALLEGTKAEESRPVLAGAVQSEGGTFDDDTGEELQPEPQPEPEPEPKAKPARKSRAATKPAADPPPEEDGGLEYEAAIERGEIVDKATGEVTGQPEPESAAEFERDEMGLTKSEDEAKTDDYILRANKCETIIDLRKLEREAEMSLAEMPVHLASCVDTAFDHARKRLSPRRPAEDE